MAEALKTFRMPADDAEHEPQQKAPRRRAQPAIEQIPAAGAEHDRQHERQPRRRSTRRDCERSRPGARRDRRPSIARQRGADGVGLAAGRLLAAGVALRRHRELVFRLRLVGAIGAAAAAGRATVQ